MEETPESLPPADEGAPEDTRTYSVTDRLVALAGLLATGFLAYIFMDVIAGGRITQALSSATPPEDIP